MDNLVDPAEPPDIQIARLKKISAVLMRRVETQTDRDGAAYSQFERAVVLEDQVRRRTEELERALRLLNESNAKLSAANSQIESVKQSVNSNVTSVKGKVEVRLDKIEKAFDTRVASALNRIGIPSKQDVEALSAKLDELSALLEHVARTK